MKQHKKVMSVLLSSLMITNAMPVMVMADVGDEEIIEINSSTEKTVVREVMVTESSSRQAMMGINYTLVGEFGGNMVWDLSNEGVLTISGEGEMEFEDGKAPWYDEMDSIVKVIVNEGVTSIADEAFYSCRQLKEVELPDSLISIGEKAFCYSRNLEQITIPKNVKIIGAQAFNTYGELTELNVQSGNKYFASSEGVLFNKDKTALIQYPSNKTGKSYAIPATVTEIGGHAFAYSKLKEIDIPYGVEVIGERAFFSAAIEEVNIPASVKEIQPWAFAGCGSVEAFNVAAENKYYCADENGVLYNKDKTVLMNFPAEQDLESYAIPAGVVTIADHAFDSPGLFNISIPDSVEYIEEYAFSNCYNLNQIELPADLKELGWGAFDYCENLKEIVLPDALDTIQFDTFRGCVSLKKVVLPKNLTTIEDYAFFGCDSLMDGVVYYDGEEENWNKIDIWEGNESLLNATIHFTVEEEVSVGNINGDNDINSADVNLLHRYIMDYEELSEEQQVAADVNSDGKVNSADVNLLYRYVMGYAEL